MDHRELRKAGLKVTAPRQKILSILENTPTRHLSAEDVYRYLLAAGEDVGLATVYRVLTQFEVAGLVKRHNFAEGQAVFELSHSGHHDHLVCVRCNQIEEFFDETIEKRIHTMTTTHRFQATDHVLNVYGICYRCQALEKLE